LGYQIVFKTKINETEMSLRLSFIVPFYNVALYIEECIRSLYAQDIPWEEYEVICVDDCSPDGSRAIIERLQKEYPTLKILTTPENLRQGGARNVGLDIAQGRYIWFVDSDDYIQSNCLQKLLTQAEEENLDILDFDFASDTNQQTFRKNDQSFDMGPCTCADYVFCANYGGRWSWRCSCVCGGLIRRELISDLRFREKVQYEDNDFALTMYARAKRVHHITDKPYYYRVVSNSTVHTCTTLTQVKYNIALIQAYLHLLPLMAQYDERWEEGVKELIKYTASQILVQIKAISPQERGMFYQHKMGKVEGLKPLLGTKVWLALQCNIVRKILF
jgi:glycosyltransferase involved in cell wall biosynthesis